MLRSASSIRKSWRSKPCQVVFSPGNVGGALRFNGSNQYVGAPDSDIWAFGTGNFTVELWANFDAPGSGDIVHAGDIGNAAVLTELAAIAPVTAVRGNNDKGPWAETVRETEVLQVGQVCIYVVHDIAELDRDPVAAGFHVVVSGHSHKPSVKEREGVLYVNPGSSGPRRFKLPVAVAELLVNGNSVRAKVVELDVERQPPLERRRLTTRRHSRRG